MTDHYILIGQTVAPVDPCDPYTPEGIAGLMEWTRWFETADRIIKQETVLGMVWVSTVFLGLDHGMRRFNPEAPPILFETMAFWPNDGGNEQARCSTWLQAEAVHRRMVAEVARPQAVLAYVLRELGGWWSAAREDWAEGWRELRGTKKFSDPLWQRASESMTGLKKLLSEREDTDWMRFG